MEQITIKSTRASVEEFKESILWLDITNELSMWRNGFEIEMQSIVDDAAESNPSTASVLLHLGDLNGRIKAVTYVLAILDVFLDLLEKREDDNRS